jgi:hypothetical protein
MKLDCIQRCFDSKKARLYEEGVYTVVKSVQKGMMATEFLIDEATVDRFKGYGWIGGEKNTKGEESDDPNFVPHAEEQRNFVDMSRGELKRVAEVIGFEIDGTMPRDQILAMVLESQGMDSEEAVRTVPVRPASITEAPKAPKRVAPKAPKLTK